MTRATPHRWSRFRAASLVGVFVAVATGTAQPPALDRDPLLSPQVVLTPAPSAVPVPATPANRLRLFRFQPALLRESPLADEERPAEDEGPDFVTFAVGNDNPYFDFRQRGDPGGVGYTRLNTQVQLFDTETTALAIGLQATTPTGIEHDGLPDRLGTTVLTPALSLYHALDEMTAVHAFVGKHVPIQNTGAQAVSRDVRYGMAVQRPLAIRADDPLRNLFLSVGALGQYRLESRSPMVIEVLPGLHYKVAENWWISGGVSVPVGGKAEPAQVWQVTCSLQF